MLQAQSIERAILRGTRAIVKRSVSFAESDDRRAVVKRQHFAITPNAAGVARIARDSAIFPELAKRVGVIGRDKATFDLERPSASRTNVDAFSERVGGTASREQAALQCFRRG